MSSVNCNPPQLENRHRLDAGLTELCLHSVSTADPFGLIEKNPHVLHYCSLLKVAADAAVINSEINCFLNWTLQVRTALMMMFSTLHTELFVIRQNELFKI